MPQLHLDIVPLKSCPTITVSVPPQVTQLVLLLSPPSSRSLKNQLLLPSQESISEGKEEPEFDANVTAHFTL